MLFLAATAWCSGISAQRPRVCAHVKCYIKYWHSDEQHGWYKKKSSESNIQLYGFWFRSGKVHTTCHAFYAYCRSWKQRNKLWFGELDMWRYRPLFGSSYAVNWCWLTITSASPVEEEMHAWKTCAHTIMKPLLSLVRGETEQKTDKTELQLGLGALHLWNTDEAIFLPAPTKISTSYQ